MSVYIRSIKLDKYMYGEDVNIYISIFKYWYECKLYMNSRKSSFIEPNETNNYAIIHSSSANGTKFVLDVWGGELHEDAEVKLHHDHHKGINQQFLIYPSMIKDVKGNMVNEKHESNNIKRIVCKSDNTMCLTRVGDLIKLKKIEENDENQKWIIETNNDYKSQTDY